MADHTLILLRHAKSDWSGGEPDRLRSLAARGRRQAAEAGRWLAGYRPGLDLAVVSPAERARATWTIAAAELAAPPPVRLEERAYAASGEALLRLVQELPDAVGTAALVGHNPGLEDLLEILTGRWLRMPTSAIAVLTLSRAWADVGPSTADLETAGRPPAP